MKKDCPFRQRDGGFQKTPKVSKVKGASKETESPEKTKVDVVTGNSSETSSLPSSTSLKAKTPSAEDLKGVTAGGQAPDQASSLLGEATVLLKTLRSMKAMKVKQINYQPGGELQPVALLDGGATHGLRTAEVWERKDLEPVQVELGRGPRGCIAIRTTGRCSAWRRWSRLCRFIDLWLWASRSNGTPRVAGSSTHPEE